MAIRRNPRPCMQVKQSLSIPRKYWLNGKHLKSPISLIFVTKLFINVSHRSWRILSEQKGIQIFKGRWV